VTAAYPLVLARAVAELFRSAREEIVERWLDRINARVTVDIDKIFPTDDLLNHVPLLIDGIAEYVEDGAEELPQGGPVLAKAMELGELRHSQGFDAYQILKEHEILGAILFSYMVERVEAGELDAGPRDLIVVSHRVAHAVEMIRQATMSHFLRVSGNRIKEQESRLRRFNRMVSHELKNRVGAIRGASALLNESWVSEEDRARFHRMLLENSDGLQHVLDNLEALSKIDFDARQGRNVLLPQAVAEAVRQLRAAAETKGVRIEVPDDLPPIEVDAAATELCVSNYVSNAIKYSDPSKGDRWVKVSAEYRFPTGPDAEGELCVFVRDNGLGVPPEARTRLFDQYYRAHSATVTDVSGTGIGLSIVRETVASLGGKTWADFPPEGGSVFAFSLPSRREEDAAAAGTPRVDATPKDVAIESVTQLPRS
jgi:signal transduction histidine kinase